LVDSGASRHFSGYKEVLSNLIERETSLKIILEDNSTYLVKERDLPPPSVAEKKYDDMDLLEGYFVPEN